MNNSGISYGSNHVFLIFYIRLNSLLLTNTCLKETVRRKGNKESREGFLRSGKYLNGKFLNKWKELVRQFTV